MVLMGIKANPNESWVLPERVEALVEALDLPGLLARAQQPRKLLLQRLNSASSASSASPAPPSSASSTKACSNHARASIGTISKSGRPQGTAGTAAGRSLIGPFSIGLPLIVLIQVFESGWIGPSLIDTAFQTA